MATARAFLRQRSDMGGDPADVVIDVNRQLCRDVTESGNFKDYKYATFKEGILLLII